MLLGDRRHDDDFADQAALCPERFDAPRRMGPVEPLELRLLPEQWQRTGLSGSSPAGSNAPRMRRICERVHERGGEHLCDGLSDISVCSRVGLCTHGSAAVREPLTTEDLEMLPPFPNVCS